MSVIIKRILSRVIELLEDWDEEYQLNVIDCHPFDGPPPITKEEYIATVKSNSMETEQ